MYFNAGIETMPLAQLRQLQSERLAALVRRVYKDIPFYKQQLDKAGVDPDSIRTIADIAKLPFTRKTDLRDNYPFGLFAVPQHKVMRLHCSSGTTGKPIVVGYTKNDIEVFAEVVARSLAAAGCRPGMKLQNAYGYGLFTGGLGLHYGAEKLGMTVIPVSGGMTDRQLLLLQDFKPEVLCCTPSYAQTLAEEIRKRGIAPDSLNLQYAVLGAEPWTDTVRAEIETSLNIKASNIYGLSEVMGPGVSAEDVDERGTGSYIWEDHFYPEIVNKDTGEPVPEGECGVLVFTTLTKEATPVLRYWTNDITNIYYDKQGKRTHIKMGNIRGRADDMLIIRGVNLFHTQVEDILKDIPGLSPQYQLIVYRHGTMDEVEVLVEVADDAAKDTGSLPVTGDDMPDRLKHIQGHLAKKIKDNIGLSMKITLTQPDTIPRSEGGKLNRIKDLRNKQ